jgi:small subunit ribosomal protein S13
MIYIFESELHKNKSIFLALMNIYGIGKFHSLLICKKLGFSKNLKVKNLSEEQINKLIKIIESLNIKLVSDLKRLHLLNKKKLINIKSYRGLRRNQGLPIRGQRTHTNSKTARKRLG